MNASLFIAYPSNPPQVGAVVESAAKKLKEKDHPIETWKQVDISGQEIIHGVLEKIDDCDCLVADITTLNFNVLFEIGYAIGKEKTIRLIKYSAQKDNARQRNALGVFDTLGYEVYANTGDLEQHLAKSPSQSISPTRKEANATAPVFLVDTLHKTDASIRVKSRLKRARLKFRVFDPSEQPRLPPLDAINSVFQSIAVVVNLLSENSADWELNNLRSAFVAGIARGAGRELLMLQEGGASVPLDYRDFVKEYKFPDTIDGYISEFAPRVVEGLQRARGKEPKRDMDTLAGLSFGDPAAENEVSELDEYYVETDEYNRTKGGTVRLVVARKGSGKTALFFQLRQHARQHPKNIVLDLKPDGYQLKRFKELVTSLAGDALREHGHSVVGS